MTSAFLFLTPLPINDIQRTYCIPLKTSPALPRDASKLQEIIYLNAHVSLPNPSL